MNKQKATWTLWIHQEEDERFPWIRTSSWDLGKSSCSRRRLSSPFSSPFPERYTNFILYLEEHAASPPHWWHIFYCVAVSVCHRLCGKEKTITSAAPRLTCRGSLFRLYATHRGRRPPSPPWQPGWGWCSQRAEWFRMSVFTTEGWARPQSVQPKPARPSSGGLFVFPSISALYFTSLLSHLVLICFSSLQAVGRRDPRPSLRHPSGRAGPPSFSSRREGGVS